MFAQARTNYVISIQHNTISTLLSFISGWASVPIVPLTTDLTAIYWTDYIFNPLNFKYY